MQTGTLRPGEHSYGLVLALVLVSVIFQVASPDTAAVRFVTIMLGAAILVAAAFTAGVHRRLVVGAAVVASGIAVSAVVYLAATGDMPDKVASVVNAVLVAVAPVVVAVGVLRQLRQEDEVTLHTLGGVLAIYLLIGVFFSFLYGAVDRIESGELFAQIDHPDRSDELYFSFTTLSTVGFGDLTARSDLGRTIAVTEGLLGQIYLVTIVALIVSNIGARRRRRD